VINNRGQVAGISQAGMGSNGHAFFWQNEKMTDLGTFGGTASWATEINERGQVVGGSETTSGAEHAFVWQDGKMTDLGTLGGRHTEATGINERGEIIGRSETTAGFRRAVLWTPR